MLLLTQQAAAGKPVPTCAERAAWVGQPIAIRPSTPPKRLKYVRPTPPGRAAPLKDDPPWIAEVILDPEGRVIDYRLLHGPTFSPPWTGVDEAIEKAVRQWEYAPTSLNNRPIAVCVTVVAKLAGADDRAATKAKQ